MRFNTRSELLPWPGHRARTVGLLAALSIAALALVAGDASASQPPVGLGSADSFAVLAGQTVTNNGPSTVNGDLGVSPGTAVTGFPPGTVNGTIHAGGASASQAQAGLASAYNDAASRTPSTAAPADLSGNTLVPGVYRSGSSLGLTGTLTLDAQGDPAAVFVFQAGSTLTTASGSRVDLINGAQPCNVVWQIGTSATLGGSSVFTGNLLVSESISVNGGVALNGRALARNGAVTLTSDTITAAHCATGGGTAGDGPAGGGTAGDTTPGPCAITQSASRKRPARPVLHSPRKNARVHPGDVKFTWRPAARAASYALQVDHHKINTGCQTTAVMRLGAGTHSYRVIARNRYGARSSRPYTFTASTRGASRQTARRHKAARELRAAAKELRRLVALVVDAPGDGLRLLFYQAARGKLIGAITDAKRAGLKGSAARYKRLLDSQTRRAKRAIRQHKAESDPHVQAILAIIQQLGIDAAQQAGARTPKEIKQFILKHEGDIARGAKLWKRDEKMNREGAMLIARGVKNKELTGVIEQLYRFEATEGDGSTMFKLIKEAEHGCVRYGCKHYEKAVGRRTQIIKLLSGDLSPDERRVAGHLVSYLNQAIKRAHGA